MPQQFDPIGLDKRNVVRPRTVTVSFRQEQGKAGAELLIVGLTTAGKLGVVVNKTGCDQSLHIDIPANVRNRPVMRQLYGKIRCDQAMQQTVVRIESPLHQTGCGETTVWLKRLDQVAVGMRRLQDIQHAKDLAAKVMK